MEFLPMTSVSSQTYAWVFIRILETSVVCLFLYEKHKAPGCLWVVFVIYKLRYLD